ncbi:MAG: hypothetical protein P9L91_04555 [Candidatus Zophobacter franzmannii]|nr:hypothetical protein [Candidatus Zophobacter franzmannii]
MNKVDSLILSAREIAETNWLKAMNIIRDGISEYPSEPALYVMMGDIYLKRNATTRSIDYFKKAIRLGNPSDELLTKIADTYLLMDDFNTSLKYYEMLTELQINVVHKKVYVLHRLNKLNKALDLLENYIWESPYPETILQYAEILAQLGRKDEALENINLGLKKFAGEPRLIGLAGIINYLSGNHLPACKCFSIVESANPDNNWRVRYLYMYAKASLHSGFTEKGLRLLEDYILNVNPDIEVFRYYLVEMFKVGRINQAKSLLQKLEDKDSVRGITLTSMKLSLNYYINLDSPNSD